MEDNNFLKGQKQEFSTWMKSILPNAIRFEMNGD